MFKNKTLLVIGAGASAEAKFPIGTELAASISQASELEVDDWNRPKGRNGEFFSHIGHRFKDQERAGRINALRRISEGIFLARSIDSFIDQNAHDPLIAEMGKVQIAGQIIQAERGSHLWFDAERSKAKLDLTDKEIAPTWYTRLAEIMFADVRRDNIRTLGREISVICFNYDRCLEFYLIEAIRTTYDQSYEDAHEIVSNMEIIHPYGTIGRLPKSLGGRTDGVPFGDIRTWEADPWSMSGGLLTFSEQLQEGTLTARIKEAVNSAEQIVFLGFSFQQQNMRLMQSDRTDRVVPVFASGYGLPPEAVHVITSRIGQMYGASRKVRETPGAFTKVEIDKKCAALLYDHAYNLAAS